jgi:hypothetical protein
VSLELSVGLTDDQGASLIRVATDLVDGQAWKAVGRLEEAAAERCVS